MSDEQRTHEPQPTHRRHSSAQDEGVIASGAHGGHHVQQPTVGEDAKENPAEGWDPESSAQA
ncbi:hypothetical protein [Agrococcus sp. ARC_14]|uniref:hypothetical protein n=1 Tax=Agrococcus sp. ARC_14 TaxID=2919927 RepID=UPI001F055297|nr:hypothetical protein [Agrococcus sp. ARC_14]MCH1882508.1 hypothetical protein [Agrococcus sp. ARC_14]